MSQDDRSTEEQELDAVLGMLDAKRLSAYRPEAAEDSGDAGAGEVWDPFAPGAAVDPYTPVEELPDPWAQPAPSAGLDELAPPVSSLDGLAPPVSPAPPPHAAEAEAVEDYFAGGDRPRPEVDAPPPPADDPVLTWDLATYEPVIAADLLEDVPPSPGEAFSPGPLHVAPTPADDDAPVPLHRAAPAPARALPLPAPAADPPLADPPVADPPVPEASVAEPGAAPNPVPHEAGLAAGDPLDPSTPWTDPGFDPLDLTTPWLLASDNDPGAPIWSTTGERVDVSDTTIDLRDRSSDRHTP